MTDQKFTKDQKDYGKMIMDRVATRFDTKRASSAWHIFPDEVRQAIVVAEVTVAATMYCPDDGSIPGGEFKANVRAAVAAYHAHQDKSDWS